MKAQGEGAMLIGIDWASYTFSPVFRTPIVKAKHGDASGVRGAAWLWRDLERPVQPC